MKNINTVNTWAEKYKLIPLALGMRAAIAITATQTAVIAKNTKKYLMIYSIVKPASYLRQID